MIDRPIPALALAGLVLGLLAPRHGLAKPEIEPIEVSFRVEAIVDGEKRSVRFGDALRTGDQVALFVEVDRPAYVYVVQFFPDGSSAALFPQEGDVKVPAGRSTRIPPTGQSFQLDAVTGQENIYVVAAARPLGQLDQTAAGVVDRVRHPRPTAGGQAKAGGNPPPRARPAGGPPKLPAGALARNDDPPSGGPVGQPSGLSLRTRGLLLVRDEADPTIRLRTDASGVGVYRFSFDHRAE